MIELQQSEWAARLRRGGRLVGGSGTKALEEIVQPVVMLDYLGYPPWRTEPRYWQGWTVNDGAAAGQVNWVICQLPFATRGVAIVRGTRVHLRESISAAAGAASLFIGFSEADLGTDVEGVGNLEPVGFHGGNVDYLPVRVRALDATVAGITGGKRIDEELIPASATPRSITFVHAPIILEPGGYVAVHVNALDAGGVLPPDTGGTFYGEFYSQQPVK